MPNRAVSNRVIFQHLDHITLTQPGTQLLKRSTLIPIIMSLMFTLTPNQNKIRNSRFPKVIFLNHFDSFNAKFAKSSLKIGIKPWDWKKLLYGNQTGISKKNTSRDLQKLSTTYDCDILLFSFFLPYFYFFYILQQNDESKLGITRLS